MSDTRHRRSMLATVENPRRNLDTLVEQQIHVGHWDLALRYVPDQTILDVHASRKYFEQLRLDYTLDLPAVAFEDINSELVPRWLALHAHAGDSIMVLQESRPNWENPALLACLKPW